MSAPKTQRAMAHYDNNSDFLDAHNPDVFEHADAAVPVLVVPEAEVKGCRSKHVRSMSSVDRWCANCGAFKGAFTAKWMKPAVMRVGRSK